MDGENRLKLKLQALGLRFPDRDLELAFRADYNQRVLGQARLSLLLGSLLYLLLGLQDPWFFPQHYGRVWLLRLLIATLLLGGVVLSYRPLFLRHFSAMLAAITLLAGLGPLVMIAYGSLNVALSYYLGLILVVVWAYTFSGLRFFHAAACNLALLWAYLLVSLTAQSLGSVWLATNGSNLLAASLLAGFAGFVIERQRRVLFHHTVLLETDRRSQEKLALSDPLTGLANRIGFERRFHAAMQHAQRQGHLLALIFIDIDNFKRINDRYGHEAGDQVLQSMAALMSGTLRAGDLMARLGGDEFVVLLDQVGSRAAADKVAAKLRAVLSQGLAISLPGLETVTPISVSLGVAIYPDDGAGYTGLLRQADSAMYQNKRSQTEPLL